MSLIKTPYVSGCKQNGSVSRKGGEKCGEIVVEENKYQVCEISLMFGNYSERLFSMLPHFSLRQNRYTTPADPGRAFLVS
jgi:hypothetical protein